MRFRRRSAAALGALVAVGLAAASPCAAQTSPPSVAGGGALATLVVTGSATVDRPPDRALVGLRIATADPTAARSTAENAAAFDALGKRLAGLGMAPAAIVTTSFSSSFQETPPPAQRSPDALYGYVTTRTLQVRVTPLARAGAVIDAAAAVGSVTVSDVTFDLADRMPAKREALASAVADARAQADVLAAAAGTHVVRVLAIQTGSGSYQPRPLVFARAAAADAFSPATTLAPSGPVETTEDVTVTYEIR